MRVLLKPRFARLFDELSSNLQQEVFEKIELFKDARNHKLLRVHPLHGKLQGQHAFSVNYHIRIVCMYEDRKKTTAILLAIGNHDVYQ